MNLKKENKYRGVLSKQKLVGVISLGIIATALLIPNKKVIDNFIYNTDNNGTLEVKGTLSYDEVSEMIVLITRDTYGNDKKFLLNHSSNESILYHNVFFIVDSGVTIDEYSVCEYPISEKLGKIKERISFNDYLIMYDEIKQKYTYDDVIEIWNKVKEEKREKVLVKE